MKITSHYRGEETELCCDDARIRDFYNGYLRLSQRRHWNKREKFYKINLTEKECEEIAKRLPKSTLVKLAEKIDSIINTLQNKRDKQ